MKNLTFEELMDLFIRSKKYKNYEEILNINLEFERRINKKKLLEKKPTRTSISGFNQTKEWLNENSNLKKNEEYNEKSLDSKKNSKNKLRQDSDINKKNTLW
mgnify:CR=1 FL=1